MIDNSQTFSQEDSSQTNNISVSTSNEALLPWRLAGGASMALAAEAAELS